MVVEDETSVRELTSVVASWLRFDRVGRRGGDPAEDLPKSFDVLVTDG
jgi:hypothetical protein